MSSSSIPLSILDLALIGEGETARDSFAASVALAQQAEKAGYRRVWYAEHHNMSSVASSAPAVLIAHVAAHTRTIRLGAGGVMLPNHAPLTIAEQFGTLEALHPGRIDLGLGRAPGTDPTTTQALRRGGLSSDRFPEDVLELQAFLGSHSRVAGVESTPGKGANVPLYILGSSLFGAKLAGTLGLPFAFASHFAPQALHEAIAVYRRGFRPSAQLAGPHVIAALNVIASDDAGDAQEQLRASQRMIVRVLFGRGRRFSDGDADAILASPSGQQIRQMGVYTVAGLPGEVRAFVEDFARHTGADELMISLRSPTIGARLRSAELLAEVMAA
jgi:luciferase family oxidoreductase group 1